MQTLVIEKRISCVQGRVALPCKLLFITQKDLRCFAKSLFIEPVP